MKFQLIVFLLVFIPFCTIAQPSTINGQKASITQSYDQTTCPVVFKYKKYDFGKIQKGVPVTIDFSFKNISDKPVLIESATAQCGCTTPVFPKSGIAAGDSNRISITYNAANPGVFMKQVTIKFLRYEQPIFLVVSGQVMPSAPQNKDE